MPGVSDEILRQIEADWHKEVDALQVLSLLALLVQNYRHGHAYQHHLCESGCAAGAGAAAAFVLVTQGTFVSVKHAN